MVVLVLLYADVCSCRPRCRVFFFSDWFLFCHEAMCKTRVILPRKRCGKEEDWKVSCIWLSHIRADSPSYSVFPGTFSDTYGTFPDTYGGYAINSYPAMRSLQPPNI